jgi:hypothetical protein
MLRCKYGAAFSKDSTGHGSVPKRSASSRKSGRGRSPKKLEQIPGYVAGKSVGARARMKRKPQVSSCNPTVTNRLS